MHGKGDKIVKNKAPVRLTGGAGFHYENPVAARFLLDLLAGSNALGVDFGRIVRLDWQTRDLGWLADDFAVTCKTSSGDRATGISIKSAQQVTRAGFPQDFVEIAWAQWLGVETDRKLRDSNDGIVLVIGSLAHDVEKAWSNLLSEARKTTPDRMLKRLAKPVAGERPQSSAIERALFGSFRCPKALRDYGDTGGTATIQLLSRVRLLRFDFDATPSRDHAQALADCQSLLGSGDASETEKLWRRVNGIADDYRPAGGFLDGRFPRSTVWRPSTRACSRSFAANSIFATIPIINATGKFCIGPARSS